MKWTRDPNRQILADDTKARVKSHETRELRLAMKSENEIQTGNVMKAKCFVCYHVTVLYSRVSQGLGTTKFANLIG